MDRADRSPFSADPFLREQPCEETRRIAMDRDRVVAGSTPESELHQLTAASGPLRRTLAAIRARLLDTQAIERLCYARLRDYARERVGLSARQLQDLAHAHRAFATLPGLERALVANELPWSKVRLLTRVATPEDEEAWIDRARRLSIRPLEHEVRALREPADGGLDAAIAPLLRIVTCPHYEGNGAYWKLADFAAEQLGMSPSKARALLRTERAGDACPDLRASFRDGRLSWAKAQCLLPLLLLDIDSLRAPDWRRRRVAWAERVTVRRLEADAQRALLLRAGHGPAFERCLEDPARARDPIPEDERQLCAPDIDVEATERLEWRAPREVAALFLAVREAIRGRLRAATNRPASDSDAFAAMLDHALATWTQRDPGKPRPDPVFERDGYLCAVPGCSSRMSFHDHHVVFRSHQGSNDIENLLTLCAFHHRRCVHAGRLRIRGLAPDRLVFELGVRPGAPPLARFRSGDVAVLCDRDARRKTLASGLRACSRASCHSNEAVDVRTTENLSWRRGASGGQPTRRRRSPARTPRQRPAPASPERWSGSSVRSGRSAVLRGRGPHPRNSTPAATSERRSGARGTRAPSASISSK